MLLKYKNVHPTFKLNGISFSAEELVEVAYSFIKEGEEFEQLIGDFLLDWFNEKETLMVKTSGSTGIPKQLVIKKQHMVNSAMATGNFFELESGNTALLCLSASYIAGKMMLVRAMVLGLDLHCVAPSSGPLANHKSTYDFCAMVPMQLAASIPNLHLLKIVIVGGAPLSNSLIKNVQKIPTAIYETYGMTETISHIALKRINGKSSKEGSFFVTLPKVFIAQDARNCLVIDAPHIADKSINTNDVVELQSDSKFNWLGRYDNIINSGGIKLYPEQIEMKLAAMLDQPYFVYGASDSNLGEKLVLVVEGKVNLKVLKQSIRTNISIDKFEIPKEIQKVDHFVRTPNGKIQRAETIALFNSTS